MATIFNWNSFYLTKNRFCVSLNDSSYSNIGTIDVNIDVALPITI